MKAKYQKPEAIRMVSEAQTIMAASTISGVNGTSSFETDLTDGTTDALLGKEHDASSSIWDY